MFVFKNTCWFSSVNEDIFWLYAVFLSLWFAVNITVTFNHILEPESLNDRLLSRQSNHPAITDNYF